MHKKRTKIDCARFQEREPVIEEIIGKINMAKAVSEKARFAEELQKVIDILLSCPEYNGKSLDCKNCHFIIRLRERVVNLIMKAKKLA